MTKLEVIEIAKNESEIQDWPWIEPILIKKQKQYFVFGKTIWRVMTNSESRGGNINILIEDKTGKIIQKAFAKR